MINQVETSLNAGLRILQYRNKSNDRALRQQQAGALRKLCNSYNATLLINDDIELAKTVQADGVHLGRDDAGMRLARQQLGDQVIIGISCYNNLTLALNAQDQGASYVAFGSFFPSLTKPDAVAASAKLLQQWKNEPIPACAIGGITTDNASQLIGQGADMIAVISNIWKGDIGTTTKRFISNFQNERT